MKAFLKSRIGVASLLAFAALMTVALGHVVARRQARAQPKAVAPTSEPRSATSTSPVPQAMATPVPAPEHWNSLAEDAAYLDSYYALDRTNRLDQDAQGIPLTRRKNSASSSPPILAADADEVTATAPVRTSLRLQGRPGARPDTASRPAETRAVKASADPGQATTPVLATVRSRPTRFNPYGRVIKCELVFTIDSANEQTPLVAVVMEPVYNNGVLVVPAGAELHGTARPDRLRDRIFSGQDWILVFPREESRPNGRQLNVKGVALDRVEPDVNGMTWGITDGSYGLEGQVIRTMQEEDIKRFVATFLSAATLTLQDRDTTPRGRETVRSTPRNAALQGLATSLQQIAAEISAEIAEHGVFIRIPAGHQFYFYPMQLIDADAADISSDIATVK